LARKLESREKGRRTGRIWAKHEVGDVLWPDFQKHYSESVRTMVRKSMQEDYQEKENCW